jgi:two-component system cell cycle sensor histidine kinase/response regulator CckA
LRRLIGEKVKLDLVHGRDLCPVEVAVSQFEQVIVNLAVNARDAMADGGKLIIKTVNVTAEDCAQLSYKGMPRADYVRIDISDTGTVFPPISSTRSSSRSSRPRKSARAPGLACRPSMASSSRPAASFMSIRTRQGHLVPHLPAAASRVEQEAAPEPHATSRVAKEAAPSGRRSQNPT